MRKRSKNFDTYILRILRKPLMKGLDIEWDTPLLAKVLIKQLQLKGYTDHSKKKIRLMLLTTKDFSETAFIIEAFNFKNNKAFSIVLFNNTKEIEIRYGLMNSEGNVEESISNIYKDTQLLQASKFFETQLTGKNLA